MPKLSDLGDPSRPTLSSLITGDKGDTIDPRYHDLMLSGLKQALGFPWQVQKSALDLYYAATGKHAVSEKLVNSILDTFNDKTVQPPQNITEQVVQAAPLIASAPGVVQKALMAAPIAVGAVRDHLSTLTAGLAQAGAAEAGVPYVASLLQARASRVRPHRHLVTNGSRPARIVTPPRPARDGSTQRLAPLLTL
jgi:hypothetical protein